MASCYANVDCWKKIVRFNFLGEPIIEWEGNVSAPKGKFISYLKAQKLILKGCIYHLVRVQDAEENPQNLRSISVVNEFPDELLGIPPGTKIKFAIDVPLDTQPLSIPTYRMASAELK
ncbi:uncharacterized protein [Nicotiana tomentosiformis]|uniref:uncharacterized protein n=1 Tax=Nicotiana tomentosiformis TaxID=4098 RepID=UPI00388CDBAD